jgi:hypothetical protein
MMRRSNSSQSGQAAILLALGLLGLVAFAALAIDGGLLYAEKRSAQNAADNAVLAAARAMCLGEDPVSAALALAYENGYDNDGVGNIVTVSNPPTAGPNAGNSDYVELVIVSNFPGALIQFVRPGGLQITVRAVSACLPRMGRGHAALFAISQTCNNAIIWSGSSSSVQGGMHSNNDVQITGSNNTISGIASYVTTINANPDKVTLIPPAPINPVHTGVIMDPLGFDIEDYAPGGSKAALAQGAGLYRYCDGDIDMNWLEDNHYYDEATDTILDGLYYATGDISINRARAVGNAVTLVAEGDVDLRGPDQVISAYMDGLLAFSGTAYGNDSVACSTPAIKLSLNGSIYEGYLYAPHGLINVSGSDIQVNGGLIGYALSLSLSGTDISVINSSEYIPVMTGTIEITE